MTTEQENRMMTTTDPNPDEAYEIVVDGDRAPIEVWPRTAEGAITAITRACRYSRRGSPVEVRRADGRRDRPHGRRSGEPPVTAPEPRAAEEDPTAEQPEHVRFQATAKSGTDGRMPWIKVGVSVEISGEWISEDMLAIAARQVVTGIVGRLGAAADDANAEAARRRGPEGPGPS
jgi:hypothetical protein